MRTFTLMLLAAACCVAAHSQSKCRQVAGTIGTNFVSASDTLGNATGDLAGGLGVHVLAQESGAGGTVLITVQHHWVTISGDTLSLDQAVVTGFPTSVPGLYAVSYLDGVTLAKGSTGSLSGATGKIYAWGAADFGKGQIVLRYSGRVCIER